MFGPVAPRGPIGADRFAASGNHLYADIWRSMQLCYAPCLGPTGNVLIDYSGSRLDATISGATWGNGYPFNTLDFNLANANNNTDNAEKTGSSGAYFDLTRGFIVEQFFYVHSSNANQLSLAEMYFGATGGSTGVSSLRDANGTTTGVAGAVSYSANTANNTFYHLISLKAAGIGSNRIGASVGAALRYPGGVGGEFRWGTGTNTATTNFTNANFATGQIVLGNSRSKNTGYPAKHSFFCVYGPQSAVLGDVRGFIMERFGNPFGLFTAKRRARSFVPSAAAITVAVPAGLLKLTKVAPTVSKSAAVPVGLMKLTKVSPTITKSPAVPIALAKLLSVSPTTLHSAPIAASRFTLHGVSPSFAPILADVRAVTVDLMNVAPVITHSASLSEVQFTLNDNNVSAVKTFTLSPVTLEYVTQTLGTLKQIDVETNIIEFAGQTPVMQQNADVSVGLVELINTTISTNKNINVESGLIDLATVSFDTIKNVNVSVGLVELTNTVVASSKNIDTPFGQIELSTTEPTVSKTASLPVNQIDFVSVTPNTLQYASVPYVVIGLLVPIIDVESGQILVGETRVHVDGYVRSELYVMSFADTKVFVDADNPELTIDNIRTRVLVTSLADSGLS